MTTQQRQSASERQNTQVQEKPRTKKVLRYMLVGGTIAILLMLILLHSSVQLLIIAGMQAIASISIGTLINIEAVVLANLTAFIATYDFAADKLSRRRKNRKRGKSEK